MEGAHLQTSASIGLVESQAADASAGELLKAADLAMYLAKDRGKGQWALFEPALQQAAAERLSLESDLRSAVRRGQLHLAFQPVVDTTTGAMTAVEALARWHHPVRGDVPPGVFFPLAEETGLIIPLGEWVLREACAQMQRWTLAGADPQLRITVNVSTRQLDQPSLLVALDECLDQRLDPSRLILEITESALADDDRRAAEALSAIRERGVHLAVDDFGTGYSSLSRLGASPISRLTIDRSFISAITSADAHVPLVEATMAMATGLGLGVVAEGVETLDQLVHLRSLNCPEVQGFLFSRPLSSDALQPLLAGQRPWQSLVEQATRQAQARPIGLATLVELAFRAEVTLEELAGPLLTQACRATGLEQAVLARLDRVADELSVVAGALGSGLAGAGDRVPWGSSLCCALMSGDLRRVDDVQALPEVAALGRQHGVRAVLCEPVYGPSGELFGILCAASTQARPLGEADSAAMRLLAGLISGKARAGSGDAAAGRRAQTRVIVIDDDLVMQQLVAATLSTAGSMQLVGTAGTGAEGIALAAAQQPDIIVLDFELPDLSAATVLERVRALSRRSRVVLYSGRDNIHPIGQRLGVDRSVYKGDGIDRLHEALSVL